MKTERNFGKLLLEHKTKPAVSQVMLVLAALFFAVMTVLSTYWVIIYGFSRLEAEFRVAPFTSVILTAIFIWRVTKIKLTSARLYEFGLKFRYEGVKNEMLFSEMSDVQIKNETHVVDWQRIREFESHIQSQNILITCKENTEIIVISDFMVPNYGKFADALVAQYRKYKSGEITNKVEENEYETFWNNPNR